MPSGSRINYVSFKNPLHPVICQTTPSRFSIFYQSPPSDYFAPNSFYCACFSSVNTVFLFISHLHICTVVLHTVYKSTPSCFSPSKGNSICFLMNQLQLVLRPTTPSLSIYSIWFMNQLHQVFYQSIPSKHSSVNFMYLH